MTSETEPNSTVVGRLLEEISWEGRRVRGYRAGGRGLENVLSAQTLQALDFLPRTAFLGAVIEAAHGAEAARALVVREVEAARLTFLPGDLYLRPASPAAKAKVSVQPDAALESPGTFTFIEAKRILSSSFQQEQLARQLFVLLREASAKSSLLLLVVPTGPPFKVDGRGVQSIRQAIVDDLPAVLAKAGQDVSALDGLVNKIDETVAWVTWDEVSVTVTRQRAAIQIQDPSVANCVDRLTHEVSRAIAWHGDRIARPGR